MTTGTTATLQLAHTDWLTGQGRLGAAKILRRKLTEATVEIEDRELEFSPLSGRLTRDGVTVNVMIYRFAGTNDPWQLEVVDHEGGSTVWDDQFPTAQDAYRAFDEAVEEDGMASFAALSSGTIH